MERWNVKQFVVEHLVEEFGYELVVYKELSYFRRILDGQHASVLNATMRQGSVSLSLGMARRDMNELKDHIVQPRRSEFVSAPWGVVHYPAQNAPFDQMPNSSWLSPRESASDVIAWCQAWIPKFESVTNLSYIQLGLESVNPLADENRREMQRQQKLMPRMVNQMLWGWRGDQDDQEFIAPLIKRAEHTEPGSALEKANWEVIERIQTWIAEHPDGIERELIGDASADFAE